MAAIALLLGLALAGVEPDFVVALDAGHGGSNLGAAGRSAGVYEKEITLDLARRIRQRLRARPEIRVVLCRESDVLVPVRARVRRANDAGAQLFISLHANASPAGPKRGSQRGFEIFVLPPGDVEVDAQAAALLAKDKVDAAWEAHRVRAQAGVALEAARRIAWRLSDALGAERDRGLKQKAALLDVLQGLAMPGVLVEVGFLDHVEEGAWLASSAGRETVADALAKAIEDLRARERRGRIDPAITGKAPVGRTPAASRP